MSKTLNSVLFEQTKELFARGFTGLLNRIDAERKRQLTANVSYGHFRRAYDSAYPEEYNRVVQSYRPNDERSKHPLTLIHGAKSRAQEAEKQALLIIGVELLKQTKDEGMAAAIVQEVAYHNEIPFSGDVLTNIREMQDFLNSIGSSE